MPSVWSTSIRFGKFEVANLILTCINRYLNILIFRLLCFFCIASALQVLTCISEWNSNYALSSSYIPSVLIWSTWTFRWLLHALWVTVKRIDTVLALTCSNAMLAVYKNNGRACQRCDQGSKLAAGENFWKLALFCCFWSTFPAIWQQFFKFWRENVQNYLGDDF